MEEKDFKELYEIYTRCFRKETKLFYKEEDWNYVLANATYVPVEYLITSLRYQKEYMSCFCDKIIDLSVVVIERDKPICVWPLTIMNSQGKWWFATNEKEVLPPFFVAGIQEKEKKKIIEDCLESLKAVQVFLQKKDIIIDEWKTKYSLLDLMKNNESIIWFRNCMEQGGEVDPIYELYLDLDSDIEDIHKEIRKSYRSLINKSKSLWHVDVISEVSDEEIEFFRNRHIEIAGRETRSVESWKRQQVAVNSGNGFIIKLTDEKGNFVGESLFEVSRDEGLYSVGVYRRDLFEQPVSHVVQWEAIKHMKELGLKYYKIGQRFYSGNTLFQRKPSDKELSISFFKEGFMSQMDIALIVKTPFMK